MRQPRARQTAPSPLRLAIAAAESLGREVFPRTTRAVWLARRERDITASVAGALFGDSVHEYTTRFELWAIKSGRQPASPEDTAPMRRGRLLEPVAVDFLREEHPSWTIERGQETYFRDPQARIGATPDAFAVDPEREGFGIIQIKSVDGASFKKRWVDPDTNEIVPPLWIAVQAIVEAHLTGASWCVVAPLRVGYGIFVDLIEIELKPALLKRLERETAAFWQMVESGDMPPPNFSRDAATIADLYADSFLPQTYLDEAQQARLRDLLEHRERCSAVEKMGRDAAEDRKGVDAEIVFMLGNAAAATLDDGTVVTARTTRVNEPARAARSFSYRRIRVKAPEPETDTGSF